MAFWTKLNGIKTKIAGMCLIDLGFSRTSENSIANKVVSNSLMDGIGGTNEVFRYGTDGQGHCGYIKKVEGADTFFPFKSEPPERLVINCGTGNTLATRTFNIASFVDNYQDLVLGETLFVQITGSGNGGATGDSFGGVSYNKNTGILSIGQMTWYSPNSNTSLSISYKVIALVYSYNGVQE